MTPEEVLSHPPRVLSRYQRELYFENGYLAVERFVDDGWLERLRRIAVEFVDRSRAETGSGTVFDIAPGHCVEAPRLRRLKRPDEQHETFWEFATGTVADVAADLVGPDVVFHHSKLNFKWNDGADQVDWHQDIQFYPHTNYSPLNHRRLSPGHGPRRRRPRIHPGQPPGAALRPVQRQGAMGRVPRAGRRLRASRRERGLRRGAGRVAHGAQLPHGARLPGEPPGRRPPAPPQRVRVRRRLSLYPPPGPFTVLGDGRARKASALGPSRRPPLPHPARLVGRLHFHLRGPDRRGRGDIGAQRHDETHAVEREPMFPVRGSPRRSMVRALLRACGPRGPGDGLYRPRSGSSHLSQPLAVHRRRGRGELSRGRGDRRGPLPGRRAGAGRSR